MKNWQCARCDVENTGALTHCRECGAMDPLLADKIEKTLDSVYPPAHYDLIGKAPMPPTSHDPVNHPAHYNSHPSGVECISITEHINFCIGNAVKYLWRAGEKGSLLEDIKKARWYIDREIARLERGVR